MIWCFDLLTPWPSGAKALERSSCGLFFNVPGARLGGAKPDLDDLSLSDVSSGIVIVFASTWINMFKARSVPSERIQHCRENIQLHPVYFRRLVLYNAFRSLESPWGSTFVSRNRWLLSPQRLGYHHGGLNRCKGRIHPSTIPNGQNHRRGLFYKSQPEEQHGVHSLPTQKPQFDTIS